MVPTKEDIANFLAVAPDAGEGRAFMFLEVRWLLSLMALGA